MIYFAPLQSYTVLPYYLAFNSVVGGVDKYFTPFYRINKQGVFEYEAPLQHNPELNIIPQVLTNNSSDLLKFAQDMQQRGFKEINLNIGCPFPMVANRHLGSGLLPYPDELNKMLEVYFTNDIPVSLSVKMRLGWKDSIEMNKVLGVLKKFPINELILHPRTGVQKYKGQPDWEKFSDALNCWDGILVGNGDILTKDDLIHKQSEFPNSKGWMIGRGLLSNPLLLSKTNFSYNDFISTIKNIHNLFIENLKQFGCSDQQILNHLKCFWEYPSRNIEGGSRIYKKLKKIGKLEDYWAVQDAIIQNY